MDRKALLLAILALICEITWLLADLDLIEIPFVTTPTNHEQGMVAGVVEDLQQNVRRRSQGSLVWDESNVLDTVFYYDSLLTLAESSAKVRIGKDIMMDLSENTLVVIEPPAKDQANQIRLVFSRGDVAARSLSKDIKIDFPSWSVTAEKGSAMRVQSQNDGQISLEMMSGTAQLTNREKPLSQPKKIESGQQVLMTSESTMNLQTVSDSLIWENNKRERYYVYDSHKVIQLNWQGPAEELLINRPGDIQQTLKISGEKSQTLSLEVGSYNLRLRSGNEISPSKDIEVRTSPKLHLLYPLPRDRLELGSDIDFSWLGENLAAYYAVQFSSDPNFATLAWQESSRQSSTKIHPQQSGAFYWRILGIDEDGFVIPPNYNQEVFFTPNPLAPPKLRGVTTQSTEMSGPTLEKVPQRLPGNIDEIAPPPPPTEEQNHKNPEGKNQPSAWHHQLLQWSHWILPAAHAAEVNSQPPLQPSQNSLTNAKVQALFEWETVPGATHYILEVDSSGDFKSPVLITKVEATRFYWSQAQIGTYYWRVAAGNNQQMGYFSTPQKTILVPPAPTPLKPIEKPKLTTSLKPAPTPIPMPKPPVPPPASIPSTDPVAVEGLSPLPQQTGITAPAIGGQRMLMLGTGLVYIEQSSKVTDSNAEVHYAGFSNPPLLVHFKSTNNNSYEWDCHVLLAQRIWKVSRPSAWPFQSDLNDIFGEMYLGRNIESAASKWYVAARTSSAPVSTALEAIQLRSEWLWGIAWHHELMPSAGSNRLETQIHVYANSNRSMIEGAIQFQRQMEFNSSHSFKVDAGIKYIFEKGDQQSSSLFIPSLYFMIPW